jgi:SAM-dependent methyltransferase
MNDDTYIPLPSIRWTNLLLNHFANPKIGAVGPTTNVVMGAQQIFSPIPYPQDILRVKFLIGFCVMVRRKALEEVGGIDDSLPGGDDFDLSIRLRKAGYELLIDRNVFVYHHGFKTGQRVHGNHWNSMEMTENTNFALINKHGLRPWLDCMKNQVIEDENKYDPQKGWREDTEGDLCRQYIYGEKVLELGCGMRKTVPWAVGVDRVPRGTAIPGVAANLISQADIIGDAQNEIPVPPNSFDTILARHILEHLPDAVKAIRSWGRVLRHGGRLIIAVPNHDLRNSIPMNLEHVHAWTPDSLRNFMESLGWKTVDMLDPKNYVSFVGVFSKNGDRGV